MQGLHNVSGLRENDLTEAKDAFSLERWAFRMDDETSGAPSARCTNDCICGERIQCVISDLITAYRRDHNLSSNHEFWTNQRVASLLSLASEPQLEED